MLARPLNLEAHLRKPGRNLDFVFFIDICLIGFFFVLMGSRFVLAPGLSVRLPEIRGAVEGASAASAVISMQRDNMILFGDGLYSLAELPAALAEYRARSSDESVILLVRVDREVSVGALLSLVEAAREAGMDQVQIAGEDPENRGLR